MRRKILSVVVFLAAFSIPTFLAVRDLGAWDYLSLTGSFTLLALIPGCVFIGAIFPKLFAVEKLTLGSVFGLALLALGVFLSSATDIFDIRLAPSGIALLLGIFTIFRDRWSGWNATKKKATGGSASIVISAAIGSLGSLWQLCSTLLSQKTLWPNSWNYYTDLPWHMGLISEAGLRIPEEFPYVQGADLAYPYGFHAALGQIRYFSSATSMDILLQFWPILFVAILCLLASSIVFRLTRSVVVAAIGTALMGLLCGPSIGGNSDFATITQYSISPTLEFGTLILLAFVILLFTNQMFEPKRLKVSLLPTLSVAVLAYVGGATKGSLWLLLCGLAVAALITNWKNTSGRRKHIAYAVTSCLAVFVSLQITVKTSGALTLTPTKLFDFSVPHLQIFLSLLLIGIWAVGASVLSYSIQDPHAPIITSLMGVGSAAVAAIAVVSHPAGSEYYFFLSAVPLLMLGTVLSFSGVFSKWGPITIVPLAMNVIAFAFLQEKILERLSKPVSSVVDFVLPLCISAVGVLIVFLFQKNHFVDSKNVVLGLVGLGLISTFGFQGTIPTPLSFSGEAINDGAFVSKSQKEAFSFLADNTNMSETIATNVHCRYSSPDTSARFTDPCDARSFKISGLSERRVLLEGWAYTPHGTVFWDESLKELNDTFFASPTAENATALKNRGVTWLYVEPTNSIASDFSQVATKAFEGSDFSLWRLN